MDSPQIAQDAPAAPVDSNASASQPQVPVNPVTGVPYGFVKPMNPMRILELIAFACVAVTVLLPWITFRFSFGLGTGYEVSASYSLWAVLSDSNWWGQLWPSAVVCGMGVAAFGAVASAARPSLRWAPALALAGYAITIAGVAMLLVGGFGDWLSGTGIMTIDQSTTVSPAFGAWICLIMAGTAIVFAAVHLIAPDWKQPPLRRAPVWPPAVTPAWGQPPAPAPGWGQPAPGWGQPPAPVWPPAPAPGWGQPPAPAPVWPPQPAAPGWGQPAPGWGQPPAPGWPPAPVWPPAPAPGWGQPPAPGWGPAPAPVWGQPVPGWPPVQPPAPVVAAPAAPAPLPAEYVPETHGEPLSGPQAVPAELVLVENGKTTSLMVEVGRLVTVGRDPSADLVVADPRVSPMHTLIERSGPGWLVTGLDPSNPTFLLDPTGRQQPVQPELGLRSATLMVGGCEILLHPPKA